MIHIQNFDEFCKNKKDYINPNPLAPQHPYRILICGPSSAGKTNLALNLVMKYTHWNKLYVVAKMVNAEDKYGMLKDWIKKMEHTLQEKTKIEDLQVGYFFDNFDALPPVDSLDDSIQNLVLIDDMITVHNQSKIEEYFIRSRKKNCSVIYLTQSFYKTPKLIRDNCSDFAIFDVGSKRELTEISKTIATRIPYEKFVTLFKECIEGEYGFMYISVRDKLMCKHIRKGMDGLFMENDSI